MMTLFRCYQNVMILHLPLLYKDSSFTTELEQRGSIANYVIALRQRAKYCEYGDALNMMLRDCLVCEVNHQIIHKRLQAEKNLTFEKALEVALAVEAADNDVKQLQKPSATVMYQTHSKNQRTPRRESTTYEPAIPPRSPCYICLGNHAPQTCSFKETQYHKCKKVGHIAKACKTKQSPRQEPNQRARRTHYVDDSQGSELEEHTPTTTDGSYNLFTITAGGQNPILLQVTDTCSDGNRHWCFIITDK